MNSNVCKVAQAPAKTPAPMQHPMQRGVLRLAGELNMGGLFATRNNVSEALEYVDLVANSLSGPEKLAMLTAVAVLCNTICDELHNVAMLHD